jgi:hypothetical protein
MVRGSSETIVNEATSWPGVRTAPGRRGELSIRFGRRELGHLHGDHALHTAFPKRLWNDLRAQGRITDHPVFPGREGPAARALESEADVRDAIALLRLNYERAVLRSGPRSRDAVAEEDEPASEAPLVDELER